ncbi:hypothetical protein [Tateyamaria pelophila]|uniref:hypothetical protein n=1 Tax=Tateyamaria pelophila TaxID=328415 RepID=UPI001CBF4463|nr:hypothetical protein [Tateyamaria pelophila]
MPTMIGKLGREKSIATLAKRIYAIEGRNADLMQRKAEKALLAANPRLSKKEGFRTGSAIKVPRITGLKVKGDVEEAKADGSGVVAESSLRLQLLASRIEDGFRTSLDRQEQALEKLADRQFITQALKSLPDNREVLKSAADRLKEQTVKDQEAAKRFETVLKEAQESLAALQDLSKRLPRR